MALFTELTSKLVATLTGTAPAGLPGTPVVPLAVTDTFRLTTGTGTGQADKMWASTRTLTASATEDIDLAGVLTDQLGAALTVVKLKLLRITADAANTNNVNVTRPASNGVPLFLAASDGIPVLPGGIFEWCAPGAGVTVTPSTGDLVTITNSAGSTSVVYNIVVIGTSA